MNSSAALCLLVACCLHHWHPDACFRGQVGAIELLCQRGADPYAKLAVSTTRALEPALTVTLDLALNQAFALCLRVGPDPAPKPNQGFTIISPGGHPGPTLATGV